MGVWEIGTKLDAAQQKMHTREPSPVETAELLRNEAREIKEIDHRTLRELEDQLSFLDNVPPVSSVGMQQLDKDFSRINMQPRGEFCNTKLQSTSTPPDALQYAYASNELRVQADGLALLQALVTEEATEQALAPSLINPEELLAILKSSDDAPLDWNLDSFDADECDWDTDWDTGSEGQLQERDPTMESSSSESTPKARLDQELTPHEPPPSCLGSVSFSNCPPETAPTVNLHTHTLEQHNSYARTDTTDSLMACNSAGAASSSSHSSGQYYPIDGVQAGTPLLPAGVLPRQFRNGLERKEWTAAEDKMIQRGVKVVPCPPT